MSTDRACWPQPDAIEGISDHQRDAAARATTKRLGILTGSPGTGKTYVTAAVIRAIAKEHGEHLVRIAAPTGKAAVRCTEALHKNGLPIEATTIHRLLEVTGVSDGEFVFQHDRFNPLECRYLFIDEASMLDTSLAASLFRAVGQGTRVMLVGDVGQLPPVGHGAPLRDLIAAGVPTGTLDEIHRNAGAIVHACREIKGGRLYTPVPKIDVHGGANLAHASAEGDAAQLEMAIALLGHLKTQGYNPAWDVQVLCPRNGGSLVGRKALNERLQMILNPPAEGEVYENATFRPNDKVICLKNSEAKAVDPTTHRPNGASHYLANGDMGRVIAASKATVIVQFMSPDRWVTLTTEKRKRKDDDEAAGDGAAATAGRAGDLDLAYAITTHKSQGSEWPVVLVVLDDNAGPVACREWLYTAISRASKLCITVGRMQSAGKMIGRVGITKRKTFLAELLAERVTGGSDGEAAHP